MLLNLPEIQSNPQQNKSINESENNKEQEVNTLPVLCLKSPSYRNVANVEGKLQEHIGLLNHGEMVNFWSFGTFSLHQLMFYILKQTGPAHINMCTWSISQEAIDQIVRSHKRGGILSINFLLDPRVKVCKANALQQLAANFPYAMTRVHAKVVLIENEEWKISIISSQNATSNPKLERGVIIVNNEVFGFDKQIFDNEFNKGRVNRNN